MEKIIMDWDRRGTVLWLEPYSEQPNAARFDTDVAAVKYAHAIEALREVYSRLQEPNPPTTEPWMLWSDGTIFSPGQIIAVKDMFDAESEARGGPLGRPMPAGMISMD
jgi:hypothetical protein